MPETPSPSTFKPTENDLLQALTIRDFKGIDHLEIPTLKRVNLLTGFNNTGKTSVLHAIAFLLDAPYWREYEKIPASFFQRILPLQKQTNLTKLQESMLCFVKAHDDRSVHLKTVLNKNTLELKPIESVRNSDNSRLRLAEIAANGWLSFGSGLFKREHELWIEDKKSLFTRVESFVNIVLAEKEIDEEGESSFDGFFFDRYTDYEETLFKKHPAGKAQKKEAYTVFDSYLEASLHLTSQHLLKLATVFKKKQARDTLLNTLQQCFPQEGITDIIIDEEGLGFYTQHHDMKLPLKQMGDGFKAVTTLLCRLFQQQGRACLIDEFENGIHYSLMPQLFTLVFELAHELDVQVFITTHSLDCVKAYAEAWKAYSEKASAPADTFATCHRLQWTHDQKRWANRYTLDKLRAIYNLDEGASHWLEDR